MIISRTPFRMSYVGGGTDLKSFYMDDVGAVISTAIDKYMYLTLHSRFDPGIRVAYSRTEEVRVLDELQHPLVREALRVTGVEEGVEITSTADIPAKGTGLGSSSSYTVGLLTALHAYKGIQVSPAKLAEMACDIEINRCGEPIGKQDQYAAAIGGLQLYEFMPDDAVVVNPVVCSPEFVTLLNESTLVFYTGSSRSASQVLKEQSRNSKEASTRSSLRRMANLAYGFKASIEESDFAALGEMLKENWSLKKRLASNISNPLIDSMYDAGMSAGAIGGKLLGAGSGGFMMFFAEPPQHSAIINALSDFRRVKFQIERLGSRVIYCD